LFVFYEVLLGIEIHGYGFVKICKMNIVLITATHVLSGWASPVSRHIPSMRNFVQII